MNGGALVPLAVLGVIVLVPLIYVVATYNTLVALRNHIRDAWGNVDTELKRRYDLIPNLVATVKGYAAHENQVLERVTQLRVQCLASVGRPDVENYPQLKADQNFLQLQRELVNTEDRIQAARRFYNGNVRDYRNKCQTFPSSLVAGAFGFESQDYFHVPPSVREVPNAEFG
jgi:LemA protein